MKEILDNVQVHMPFRMLLQEVHMRKVMTHQIHPEISFTCFDLDNLNRSDCEAMARRLHAAGRHITFHAPFMDLRPGALDLKIRQVTIDRLRQVFNLVPLFRPETVVCHPSFDERYYVSSSELWLEQSIATWTPLISLAEERGTTIGLENVYETEPHILRRLFEALQSELLGFCFDTGHFNVFSRVSLDTWADALFPYLRELHIHDNGGSEDDHLPVGEGTFPFGRLCTLVGEGNRRPLVTLEAHSGENLRTTLRNIQAMGLPGLIERPLSPH